MIGGKFCQLVIASVVSFNSYGICFAFKRLKQKHFNLARYLYNAVLNDIQS